MIASVRKSVDDARLEYPIVARTDWIQTWPGQCVLCVGQVNWTSEVHVALLASADRTESMREYHNILTVQKPLLVNGCFFVFCFTSAPPGSHTVLGPAERRGGATARRPASETGPDHVGCADNVGRTLSGRGRRIGRGPRCRRRGLQVAEATQVTKHVRQPTGRNKKIEKKKTRDGVPFVLTP